MKEIDLKLMQAAGRSDTETVGKLLDLGANINVVDQWNNTALSNAVWEGNLKVTDFLFNNGAEIHVSGAHNLMIQAVFNAKLNSVLWLLEKQVDPNIAIEKTGETALHCTIVKKNNPERTKIIKALIKAGADVNKQTIPGAETSNFMRDAFLKGEAPLHRAAAYGDEEMINALVAAGGDLSMKDANGDTPISWASWHLRPPSVLGILLYGDVPGWHGFPNPNLNGADLK